MDDEGLRSDDLTRRLTEIRSGLESIPGLDPLQFVVAERLAHMALMLSDFEKDIVAHKIIDMGRYNQSVDVFNRLSRTLFEGAAKAITQAHLERMFVERVMGAITDVVTDEDVLKQIADRLDNIDLTGV